MLKVGDSIGIGATAGEISKCTLEVVLIQFDITAAVITSCILFVFSSVSIIINLVVVFLAIDIAQSKRHSKCGW